MTFPSMSISQRYELSKSILEEEQRCFHPDAPNGCSPEGPIKSHSVSRGMSLAAIAEDGHVISITKPFDDIVFDDRATVKPSGVKISSVFPGFCRKHDNGLFLLIETEGWNLGKETCFLLSYRSFSNTILNSRTKIRYFEHMHKIDKERVDIIRSQDFSDEDIRRDYDFWIFARRYLPNIDGREKDLEINDTVRLQYAQHAEIRVATFSLNPYLNMAKFFDKSEHLSKLKEMFVMGGYGQFRYTAFGYNCVLPFVGSKTIRVQSEVGASESIVMLNVCSNKKESFIVFGWIEDGGVVKCCLDSVMLDDENRIINNVLGYLFKNPTNTYFNPSWWKSLSEEKRHIVLLYHENELHAFPDKIQSNEDYEIFIPEFPPARRIDG